MPRKSRALPIRDFLVVVGTEEVAVLHERDRTAIRRDLQPVPVQLQCAVDLGSEQAADVGAVGIDPVLVQVPADRRAANVVILLDADDIETRFREECGGRQAIVSRADDDRVIGLHTSRSVFPGAAFRGRGCYALLARRCFIDNLRIVMSTACSNLSRVSWRQSTL